MRKRDRAQMDEMQKEKLLKINSNGMKLCSLGLLLAILIQWFLRKDFSSLVGELIIYCLLTGYTVTASLYEGLWEDRIRPSWKTNLLLSLAASLALGLILFIRDKADPAFVMAPPAILARMAVCLAACFALLSVLLIVYRKRRAALDDVED